MSSTETSGLFFSDLIKRNIWLQIFLGIFISLVSGQSDISANLIKSGPYESTRDAKILVHYMPWYQSPIVSGYWGWHWTMNHFDPDNIDESGQREIASHYYPLTGPYDSQDNDILEYQVLLMKLGGIDGIIVDWYGTENFWDYGIINESTHALFEYIDAAQLFFSICYEDQSIGHMVNEGHIGQNAVHSHGQSTMLYLEENWFNQDAYLQLSEKPLLLNFGPQYYYESSDWEILFSVLEHLPSFFTLDDPLGSVTSGAFPWPPMWASDNGHLSQETLNNYLSEFYLGSANWDHLVASAFPGFYDIYEEAGLGFSYGYLDPLAGETFQSTLETALSYNPEVLQIVTWNDYGEGTVIEPTTEFGTQYLEMIQDKRREWLDPSFSYTAQELNIPLQIYNLRKAFESDEEINETLDLIFEMIIDGNVLTAVEIIDSLNSSGMAYQSGWNLIGLSHEVENSSYIALFPDAVDGTLFSFNEVYLEQTHLTAGEGYWLLFPFEGLSFIYGEPIDELIISLSEGWNLISGVTTFLNITDIQDSDGIIVSGSVYGFNEAYISVNQMEPGRGYWIRANSSGTISMTSN